MKKLNNKGFAFVETIIALTVLLAALVAIYATFTNLLNKEQKTARYESKGDQYSLFYIKEYLVENNLLSESTSPGAISDGLTKIKNVFYLKNLYLVECTAHPTINVNPEFNEYVSKLGACKADGTENTTSKRLVGEFSVDGTNYTYASLIYPDYE